MTTATATKASLKKWVCAASNFTALIPSRLIRQMSWQFFGGWILKDCIKVQKKKRKVVVVVVEIRHFHVVVVQRRQRSVQKSVMHVQSCCFANLNLLRYCRSRWRRCCRCTTTTWKCLISRLVEDVNTRQRLSFSFPELSYRLLSTPEKFANIWRIERVGISAIKF